MVITCYFNLLVLIIVALFISACSSGDDGGSVFGSGSSCVEGTVTSNGGKPKIIQETTEPHTRKNAVLCMLKRKEVII